LPARRLGAAWHRRGAEHVGGSAVPTASSAALYT
jgi:hypothetical protein